MKVQVRSENSNYISQLSGGESLPCKNLQHSQILNNILYFKILATSGCDDVFPELRIKHCVRSVIILNYPENDWYPSNPHFKDIFVQMSEQKENVQMIKGSFASCGMN